VYLIQSLDFGTGGKLLTLTHFQLH